MMGDKKNYPKPNMASNYPPPLRAHNARLYPISQTSFFQKSPRLRGETGAPSPRETTAMSRAPRRDRRHNSVVGFRLRDSTTYWDPARQMHLHLHICPPASLLPLSHAGCSAPMARSLSHGGGSAPTARSLTRGGRSALATTCAITSVLVCFC